VAAVAEGGALDAVAAEDLVETLDLWRNVQGLLKLTVEEPFDEAAASPALKAHLARGAGAVDFARLKADMDAAAQRVLARYEALIEAPARAARARRATVPPSPSSAKEQSP
jgi:glutamate-ammonia-ligase adenylyltransferase